MRTLYLGDGVYASDDGFSILLTTGSHEEADADNKIYLESEVLATLKEFVASRGKEPSHPAGPPDTLQSY